MTPKNKSNITKPKRTAAVKSAAFFENVAQIIESARKFVGRTADLTMCITYFEVGKMIVEEEQGGKARAEYGKGMLAELSAYLTARFGKGFSISTLKNARKFYEIYATAIGQTMFAQFTNDTKEPISQTMITKSRKRQSMLAFFENENSSAIGQTMFAQSYPFKVSWSHYLILMRIKNPAERSFYEIEAAKQQWTVQHLKRQYGSSLYERLALSRNKKDVMKLATEGHTIAKPQDILKNPLVLEFLGMAENASYSETNLESAIIDKLSNFLLELGMGFHRHIALQRKIRPHRRNDFAKRREHLRVGIQFVSARKKFTAKKTRGMGRRV